MLLWFTVDARHNHLSKQDNSLKIGKSFYLGYYLASTEQHHISQHHKHSVGIVIVWVTKNKQKHILTDMMIFQSRKVNQLFQWFWADSFGQIEFLHILQVNSKHKMINSKRN